MFDLELKIKVPENSCVDWSNACLLHGFLMEKIDHEYAAKMHEDTLKPYRQALLGKNGSVTWSLSALNDEAAEQILNPLMKTDLNKIELKYINRSYEITDKRLTQTSYEDLVRKYYFGNCPRKIRVDFLSPTSFKSSGEYLFYPDIRCIFQSLIRKFDAFSEQLKTESDDILEQFTEHCHITSYRLQSSYFSLEGIKVPAFTGSVKLSLSGPQPFVNLAVMLLHYGEYSGIGMKTSLGMGTIKINEENRREENK